MYDDGNGRNVNLSGSENPSGSSESAGGNIQESRESKNDGRHNGVNESCESGNGGRDGSGSENANQIISRKRPIASHRKFRPYRRPASVSVAADTWSTGGKSDTSSIESTTDNAPTSTGSTGGTTNITPTCTTNPTVQVPTSPNTTAGSAGATGYAPENTDDKRAGTSDSTTADDISSNMARNIAEGKTYDDTARKNSGTKHSPYDISTDRAYDAMENPTGTAYMTDTGSTDTTGSAYISGMMVDAPTDTPCNTKTEATAAAGTANTVAQVPTSANTTADDIGMPAARPRLRMLQTASTIHVEDNDYGEMRALILMQPNGQFRVSYAMAECDIVLYGFLSRYMTGDGLTTPADEVEEIDVYAYECLDADGSDVETDFDPSHIR